MSESTLVQLLDLAAGAFLLTAVLILWRRELTGIIRLFTAQGIALTILIGVLAVGEGSLELGLVGLGVGALRAGLLPYLMRRALSSAEISRETRPLVNVTASLVATAGLALLAYAVSRPVVALAPGPATAAVPVALTVAFIGFLVLTTRRRAVSQLVGFLLLDNAITAIAFLTTSGVGLVVEVGVSLDVLLAVLVLRLLTVRMRSVFGHTDLDDLRELRD